MATGASNSGGAVLVEDFGTQVAMGLVPGWSVNTKFGRNPVINTTSDPEDVWTGGGDYTGFNATANENISISSADVDDQGAVLSSGTATGGSVTTLIDTGATFQTDTVAAGDMVLNDTKAGHGVVLTVDSETQLTVHTMTHGVVNASGDAYRVVNANDTGAAIVRIEGLLDADYAEQLSKYAVLNGTTGVTVTGNYMRCSRAKVILAGSSGGNEGIITATQAVTTANVFIDIQAGVNQTQIAATTVPAGKVMVLKRQRIGIARANAAAGSATATMRVRQRGEVFRAVRDYELTTGDDMMIEEFGAEIIPAAADVKVRIDEVASNATVAESSFEYYLVDV